MARPEVNWNDVKRAYEDGSLTLRALGEANGVTHTAIRKRAERDGWARGEKPNTKIEAPAVRDKVTQEDQAGFLYVVFVDTGERRLFKIGISKSFAGRMVSHQTSSPFEVRVACCYYCGNMRKEERSLHAIFEDHHVRGEWYSLSHDDLAFIVKRSLLV